MENTSTAHNILFIKFKDQYEMCSTFMRLSEFYEGPKFRNKTSFDFEEYMDWYAATHGNFTYTSDQNGYNIPGNVVRKFFNLYWKDLFDKEAKLYNLISNWIEGEEKFYVIGTYLTDNTVDHEFAHSYYYMFPEYKRKMRELVKLLPLQFRKKFDNKLLEDGYKFVTVSELIKLNNKVS